MHQINLSDEAFNSAKSQAEESGFASVESYLESLLLLSLCEQPDLDARFTPEVISNLDTIANEMEAGRYFTLDELTSQIENKSRLWKKHQAS